MIVQLQSWAPKNMLFFQNIINNNKTKKYIAKNMNSVIPVMCDSKAYKNSNVKLCLVIYLVWTLINLGAE